MRPGAHREGLRWVEWSVTVLSELSFPFELHDPYSGLWGVCHLWLAHMLLLSASLTLPLPSCLLCSPRLTPAALASSLFAGLARFVCPEILGLLPLSAVLLLQQISAWVTFLSEAFSLDHIWKLLLFLPLSCLAVFFSVAQSVILFNLIYLFHYI
jgi:hypothetical protein